MAIPCQLIDFGTLSECNIAADDVGPCMGIELNILEQAKVTFAIIRTIIIIAVIDLFKY